LAAALAGFIVQSAVFINTDIRMYSRQLHKEETSPSLAFYDALYIETLQAIEGEKLVFYRDWHMYVNPYHPGWRWEMSWELASYELMAEINPDVILLERANLDMVTQPGALENAARPDDMGAWQRFYEDAAADRVPGYQVVYSDRFGLALLRADLADRIR
jgi:hypothetical protein